MKTSFGEMTIEKFNIESISFTASPQQQKQLDEKGINININNSPQINIPTISIQQNVVVEKPVEKNKENNNSYIKFATGFGSPYGFLGGQIGLMLNERLEIVYALGTKDDTGAYSSCMGLKYFYAEAFKGSYLCVHYGTTSLLADKTVTPTRYTYLKGASVGLGYELKFGNFIIDFALLYIRVLDVLPTELTGKENGIQAALGFGIAI